MQLLERECECECVRAHAFEYDYNVQFTIGVNTWTTQGYRQNQNVLSLEPRRYLRSALCLRQS